MKANEAPDKIFLDEDESWHLTNPNEDSVEYIRKDAFVEKTAKWLSNAFHKNCDGTFNYVGGNDCSIEDIINVFKKAQKG